MTPTRNDNGRALEYGIAVSFANYLPASLITNTQLVKAKECFELQNEKEQKKIVRASQEVANFLCAYDKYLADTGKGSTVTLQSDQMGQKGDVRDIIIYNKKFNKTIGISAKNRHWGIKNPRISGDGDFGYDWFGRHCSTTYFNQITPIFAELNSRKVRKEKWNEIPDKTQRYYVPILNAFIAEIKRLSQSEPEKVAKGLLQYVLGKFDYYKVTKENGSVSIVPFNTNGTIGWGSKTPISTRIIEIAMKAKSETTIEIIFDKGWHIAFRLHSAESLVIPSVKFDVTIIGIPSVMLKNFIKYT